MADTDLDTLAGAGAAGASADDQSGADTGTTTNTAQTADDDTPDPIANLASELGWVPKDQFRGNADDWKPADEFIRAGRDITRNLSRDLKELKGSVSRIVSASTATLEQQIADQKRQLETRFTEAVEAGDPEAARQVTNQIAALDQRRPQDNTPPTPEGQDFVSRHASWYGKNQEATSYAVNRAGFYGQQGLSPAKALAAVEKDMREVFPELVSTPTPGKAPPSVARPASRTATSSSRAKTFHDLPAEAQKIAKDMVDRGVIPSTDAYVANFFKEKVG